MSKNKIQLLFVASMMGVCVNAQITTLGNAGLPTDYVGWDNTNPFPLQIRHNANQEIHTYSNNLLRMKVVGDGGTGTLRETSKKFQ